MTFSNVLSYGSEVQTINFLEGRCVLVSGANGCGKSSIPTILEEILFNKNSRGIKKGDLFHRGEKAYDITLDFNVNADSYRVVKAVKSSTKVTLFCNGEDISGHTATQTYSFIEGLLGLDFNTFSKMVYQSVGSSLDFLTATDANRKKFLVSLQGLEAYENAESVVKNAAKEIKSELDRISGVVSSITTMINRKQSPIQIVEEVHVPTALDVSEEVMQLKIQAQGIDQFNVEATRTQRFNAIYENLANNPKTEAADVSQELQNATKEYTEAHQLHRQCQSTVNKYEAQPTSCPTCGHSLDVGDLHRLLEEAREKLSKSSKGLPEVSTKVTALQAQNLKFQAYSKYKTDLEIAKVTYDSTKPTEVLDKTSLIQQITKLQASASLVSAEIAEAQRINQNSSKSRILEDSRKQELDTLTQSLSKETLQLAALELANTDLQILVKALGTKGLISYKIESMIKVFEDLINKYLVDLSEGRFALTFVVDGTKLALALYDNAEEIDIKSLSSGELNRVNTATLLAVRKLMSSISKTHINLLFLDEVVSVLDEAGKDCLIEVLLAETDLNSYVVSHGYNHPLADKLEVVKVNGKSKLVK